MSNTYDKRIMEQIADISQQNVDFVGNEGNLEVQQLKALAEYNRLKTLLIQKVGIHLPATWKERIGYIPISNAEGEVYVNRWVEMEIRHSIEKMNFYGIRIDITQLEESFKHSLIPQ